MAMNPPTNAQALTFYIGLRSASDANTLQSNPTIAAGDFKVSKDDGAFANLTTLPVVSPTGSVKVKIALSAAEMTADNVTIAWIDQTATKEWADGLYDVLTTAP